MQKKYLKRTILLLLLVGIVYACMNEDRLWDTLNPQEEAAITEAKAWYESRKGMETLELRSSSTKGRKKIKPVWENAFMKRNKDYQTVEVLLAAEKGYGFVTPDCYAKYEETGDSRYLRSHTCLVVRTDKKTGQTDGFIMTLSPDLAYLEHSEFNPFRKNSYLERDKKFSGLVVYHDMNGDFVNAWCYDNGIAYALTPGDETTGLELRSGSCTLYYYISITETCWYTVRPGGEDTLSGYTVSVDSYSLWWDCSYVGGGGYSGGGGGSLPTEPTNPPTNPCNVGITGNTNNTNMLSNTDVDAYMDDILKEKVTTSNNEWSVSIGRYTNGTYVVSDAQENGPTSGTIPYVPGGDYVANGHSHCGSPGVPSNGDLYSFLESVVYHPTLETMYVYGIGWYDSIETYAINVHSRELVRAFLSQYPKSDHLNSFMHEFADESPIRDAYDDILVKYNKGYRDIHGVTYHYMQDAVALSYLMSKYNMGVTLSRRVNEGPFKIIRVEDAANSSGNPIIDITTCQ
jgi:hypothetical protein